MLLIATMIHILVTCLNIERVIMIRTMPQMAKAKVEEPKKANVKPEEQKKAKAKTKAKVEEP